MKKISGLVSLFFISSVIFILFIVFYKKYNYSLLVLSIIMIFAALIIFILSLLLRKINMLFGTILFSTLFIVFLSRIIYINHHYNDSIEFINDSAGITGYVYSFPIEKKGIIEARIKVLGIKRTSTTDFIKVSPFIILLKIKGADNGIINRGDMIFLNKPVKIPKAQFYNISYDEFLFYSGIFGLVNAKGDEVKKTVSIKKTFWIEICRNTIWSLRGNLLSKLKSILSGKVYGFVVSIFFGIRSELDEGIYNQFINTGMVHLLAISGLNIGGIGILFFRIFNTFLSKTKSYLLTDIALYFIVAMILQSASCDRAFYMYLLFSIFFITGKNVTGINILSITCILMMFMNPYCIFDAGFQLSFFATAGILLLQPVIEEKLPVNMFKSVKSGISVTLSSFLSIVILLVALFQKVQLMSVVSSIIIVPLFSLVFYFLLFAVPALYFFNFSFLKISIELISTGFLKIIELLDYIPPLTVFHMPQVAGYLVLPALVAYFYVVDPYFSGIFLKFKFRTNNKTGSCNPA